MSETALLTGATDAGTDGNESPGTPWHVLWTRSHYEQLVYEQLIAKAFHPFLPTIEVWLGTCPSDRYSSNRLADNPSTAQDSSAINARPAGSGRRVPRSKYTGTPARAAACSIWAAMPARAPLACSAISAPRSYASFPPPANASCAKSASPLYTGGYRQWRE